LPGARASATIGVMSLLSTTYAGGAPFDFRRPPRDAGVEPAVLRAADGRELRALYWTPPGVARPRLAVIAMHPRVDFTRHYTFPRLVEAGIGCLGANTRSPNNDVDTEHEALLLDLAACVRWLKGERGAEHVILLGNSGGGSLAAFYQAEARLPPEARLARTPAGGRTRLAAAELIPADALIFVAAHRGQGKVLGACIDPAVVDERDPLATDPDLDMYDPRNGFRPPPAWSEYPEAFVARYRAAQRARVLRLDATARALLEDRRAAMAEAKNADFAALPFADQQRIQRRAAFDPVMVIYRTMANPSYTDRRLDPSGREYGSLLSDRPDLMNMALLGFGRICTPRAWLSTWSAESSNADLVRNVARFHEPALFVHAGRDREIYPRADARPVFEAAASPDKTFVEIAEARHYFEAAPGEAHAPGAAQLMDMVIAWIQARFAPGARAPASAPAGSARHPTARGWQLPPADRAPPAGPVRRTNLRALGARPGRFEHHLTVVARLGAAQLEVVVASEPLAFAHRNLSDEYVLSLPTGDPTADAVPLRTFLSDPETSADVGRINHRAGDLILHPYGLLHWPGRLRPPYEPFRFPPGTRRTGLSLVYCASRVTPPDGRPLFVDAGREGDAKAYGEREVPFLLTDVFQGDGRRLGTIGGTALDLLVSPARITPPSGGWLVVLGADPASAHFAGDLLHVPAGATVSGEGIHRALLLSSDRAEPAPPPASWDEVPAPPFPAREDAPAGPPAIAVRGLEVEQASPATARVRLDGGPAAEVPRHWLARMLFRLALHGFSLGYVETYGGFFAEDDGAGNLRIGVRGQGHVVLAAHEAAAAVEGLYRSVAPPGYTERVE
jgi:alpha-beta hydrolase superfamily lysophospholipase